MTERGVSEEDMVIEEEIDKGERVGSKGRSARVNFVSWLIPYEKYIPLILLRSLLSIYIR